ncbi:MAG: universal stress protein [Chloroflexota bacterium]|nr:MAG: universal stress protein [Chloroflexota bacterium]
MRDIILCPTRGGEGSFPNQDRAIEIAKERGAEVLFLYITNVEFLGLTAAPKLIDIEAEMDEMGEFMLTMAQERAERAGINALTLVKRGHFRVVLIEVIEEYDIETVVLGSSSGDTGVITADYLHELMTHVSGKTGVEFIIVDQGEIMKVIKP